MTPRSSAETQTILFGVTSSQSLKLLGEIPSAMANAGWDVHVVAGDTESELPPTLSGVRLHTLPMVRSPSLLKDAFSLVSWIILLRKVEPSIVFIGTPKAGLLGMIASFLCRVPVRVYQLRGLRLQTVSGLARNVLSLTEWLTAKCSTKILAVSNSLKDEYSRLGLSEISKVEVLGLGSSHGVNVHRFHRDNWSVWEPPEPKLREARSKKTPIVGFVGRFSRDKGAEELLECSKLLLESGNNHYLLIVGPVEGEEQALQEFSELNKNTIITGSVLDVAPYYSIMDLLVLPTHREGFPNAVLEAAASGVPAVTTNATGAIDSVISGETGIIVPAHDANSLAEAVIRLLKDPELIEELGMNARKWVLSNFSSDLVTKRYSAHIIEMLWLHAPHN